jgi:hypothetical protein
VFPLIISSSAEEAEWYKDKLFVDPVNVLANVHVLPRETIKEIANLPLPKGEVSRPPAPDALKTAPTVRIVMGVGREFTEATLGAEASVMLLGKIESLASGFPLLAGDLSRVQAHLNQYLKTHH